MTPSRTWSMHELQAALPNVRQPLGVARTNSAGAQGGRLHRQRWHRAVILSVARTQIDDGLAEVNVRDLADRSELCVQTIYNLVGGKREILAAAVDEHYRNVFSVIENAPADMNVFDGLADALWFTALQNPCYCRSLNRHYFQCADSVYSVIRKRVRDACLRAMRRRVGKQDSRLVDHQLAEKMHALIAISALDWAHERISTEELRARLADDFKLVLQAVPAARPALAELA